MQKNITNIWEKFNKELYVYILSRVKDSDAAKDILQDSFIKIQKNISALEKKESLRFWLYKITYNSTIDYFRSKKNFHSSESIEDFHQETENDFKTSQLAECIVPFINKLPDKYKEALTLTEFKNYSQIELAKHLGISYSGAKSRVQRAKVKLRELFEECCSISYDSYGNIIEYHSKQCKKC